MQSRQEGESQTHRTDKAREKQNEFHILGTQKWNNDQLGHEGWFHEGKR